MVAKGKTKKLLQLSLLWHQGEFGNVSVSAWQQSQWYSQNLCGHFQRAVMAVKVEANAWAMVPCMKTKALVIPAQKIIHLIQRTTEITMA